MSEESQANQANGGVVRTRLHGIELLLNSRLNKGTAFTQEERDAFGLHGLLPPHIGSLEDQRERRKRVLDGRDTAFLKYSNMRDVQDNCETLFYSLIAHHTEELLPVVYTPTVGEGCQRFSEIWRRPRGLFLSYTQKDRIEQILADPRFDEVRCIVVSDGERILGLGDQGAGGMGIPIGKMALYTALGGIPPEHCLPILLDVGTDREALLNDPIYIGWQHKRVRGAEYDAFIEEFVTAVERRWPNILLQWEDFAGVNAAVLLRRYRDRLCTFNDDIQGTAAVAAGTLLAAINVTATSFIEQRIALFGAGSAGIGIAALLLTAMKDAGLSEAEARRRFYAVDKEGLLVEGTPGMRPAQEPFAQPRSAIATWKLEDDDHISLLDVVKNAKPTTLIGVSGQAGAFTEEVIRTMAASVERPVIFPLSNPTSRSEATPEDLLKWTEGRALIGTGSPFAAVNWNGRQVPIDQTNNSYIFPGMGLGMLSVDARRVTDTMFMAAAKCLAELSPARRSKSGRLLPPVSELRAVSFAVAKAVALQAINDGGVGRLDEQALEARIRANVWEPVYLPYRFDPSP